MVTPVYGINPIHELAKLAGPADEALIRNPPRRDIPAPAPQPVTLAEGKQQVDKLRDKLALDDLLLKVAEGVPVTDAVNAVFPAKYKPASKPAQPPRPKLPPTAAEMDAAGIPPMPASQALKMLRNQS
jgi:hypothetical protein